MLTAQQVLDNKDKILTEAVQEQVGCMMTHSFQYLVEAGIMQVFAPCFKVAHEFREFSDFLDANIEEFLPLFTEDEMDVAFAAADLGECGICGWWCDDLHYSHPDTDDYVCGDCQEED